ncbi:DUF2690 domain-containing protein [Dactylosporangium sp. CA-139114]|uniref:DUF2690 domain-containing protein n=1 Tax=Dactylosporangium sp. CA-139114 TaxID=3239931 RepID=UPI003D96E51F
MRAIAMAAAVVATALVITPGRAFAATWDGQMASQTVCGNTVITGAERTITTSSQLGTVVGKVELRYSTNPNCRTVWARITSKVVASNQLGGFIARNSDGASYQCSEFGWSDNLQANYCLTPMLNDAGVTSYAKGAVLYQGAYYFGQTTNY